MRRILLFFLMAVGVAVLVLYLIPVPQRSFSELYTGPASHEVALLDSIRALPMKSLTHNGVDWPYLTMGSGPRTIVFLHGMAGAHDIWWQQLAAFSKSYKVITMTYPPVQRISEMGAAVIAILDAEQVGKVIVVGSSLGGYLTQFLVSTYPERVEQAVFGNTFPPNDLLEEQNRTLGSVVPWLPEWLVMNVLRGGLQAKTIPASGNDPLTAAFLLEGTYGRMSRNQFYARYRCVVDKFVVNAAGAASIPLLIVESGNDPLVPEVLREQLRQTYPTADVLTYPDAGHFPYINHAADYNATLQQFFDGSLD